MGKATRYVVAGGSAAGAAGVPLLVEVSVRNFGSTKKDRVSVSLAEDGNPRPAIVVEEIRAADRPAMLEASMHTGERPERLRGDRGLHPHDLGRRNRRRRPKRRHQRHEKINDESRRAGLLQSLGYSERRRDDVQNVPLDVSPRGRWRNTPADHH